MSQEDVVLAVDERTVTGKKVARLRADGKVPAVVYDHGKTSHVTVDAKLLDKAFQSVGRSQALELSRDGKKSLAMIKQVDRHPVKHTLRHVAFQSINRNEKVVAEVAIRLRLDEDNEQTPAERAGLIVLRSLDDIEIRAVAKNLPEELVVNGEDLREVGDRLTLGDIKLPEGVEFADMEIDLDQVIMNVYEPSAIAAANDAAGGDAEAESATSSDGIEDAVKAEHGEATNQNSNDGENRPGGKKEFEKKGE